METIYLVFGKGFKKEDIIYVGTEKDEAINYYFACHNVDLDNQIDISYGINYNDSWIQTWKNGKLVEKEWRPNINGLE
ncbi:MULTISPECIES: hypothetical protein [unclassified Bacillus (in: firmicutes)]|uniref:hypothetical protein n=1 Tax=unclassified Bacillus (in: firmicutes) TaxID=185979 RepID=UPI000BEF64B7|nr:MULTISPECIES: hypothetical protein [unclassified Bacillus (in: firmicutes)]PEJ52250.1 hypothetical protein CN692_22105 [Bacillus sp. AFS002410]PEL13854.1 hypothetical protein CN601_02820 [Bacillus sp. AFS017336]